MAKGRERQVFPTDRIPHIWWYGPQDSARNPGGNYYFTGDTIYSYGSHFPIARKFKREGYPDIVLFTRRTYSTTTSNHIYLTRRAIPDRSEIITVTEIRTDRRYCPLNWNQEFADLMWALNTGLKAQLNARSKDHLYDAKCRLLEMLRLVYYFNGYRQDYSDLFVAWGQHLTNPDFYVQELREDVLGAFNPFNGKYIADNLIGWFMYAFSALAAKRGSDGPLTEVEIYKGLTAGEYTKELWSNFDVAFDIPQMSAKRRTAVAPDLEGGTIGKAKSERISRRISDCKKAISDWYAGAGRSTDFGQSYDYLRTIDPSLPEGQLLRIDPTDPRNVETNWGMKVARADAFLLYRWLRALKEAGKVPSHIPSAFQSIGGYAVQTVSRDFKIKIGCHLFTWDSVEKLAAQAEWELALTSEE